MKKNKIKTKVKLLEQKGSRRVALIFVCVYLCAVIVLGSALGIASAVRRASYVMYSGGVGVTEGVANYFSAIYKTQYLIDNGISGTNDTQAFWASQKSDADVGITNGDDLKAKTTEYIKALIASNIIFNLKYTLSTADREKIDEGIDGVFKALGVTGKKEFNKATEKYGFDYKDFEKAAIMLYKDSVWPGYTLGSDGSGVLNYPELLNNLSERYSRVKLIFIKTGSELDLTEEQRAERLDYIEKLKVCIDGINSGDIYKDGFDSYADIIQSAYNEITDDETGGYYLYRESSFTQGFLQEWQRVAELALSLKLGKGAYIELTEADGFVGYCFMYRDELNPLAFADTSQGGFFEDYYFLAAKEFVEKELDEYDDFSPYDEWDAQDVSKIPYVPSRNLLIPTF